MRLMIMCFSMPLLVVRAVRLSNVDSDEPIENADYEVAQPTTPVPLYFAHNTTAGPPKDEGNPTLSTEIAGQRCLKSVYNSYLRGWRTQEDEKARLEAWKVDMAPHCDTCEHWNIEARNGKVMLQANCAPGKYLRANRYGSVDLTSEWGEYWTPFKDEDGSWSLRSKHGTWLLAHPNGQVYTQNHQPADKFRLQSPPEKDSEEEEDEVFTSSPAPSNATLFTLITSSTTPSSSTMPNQILKEENGDPLLSAAMAGLHCVRGIHRMYLRASNNTSSVDMAPYGKGCTHLWTIEDHHGKVALKATEPGLFLRATPDGKVDLAEWGREGVMWTPFKNEDTWTPVNRHGAWGTWSLRSVDGTWLRGHAHGAVSLKDHLMADEKFRLESDGDSEEEANRSTETSTTTVSSSTVEEEKHYPRNSAVLAEPTRATSITAYEYPIAGEDDWEDLSRKHIQSAQHNFSVSLIIAVLLLFIAVICATIYTVFHVRRLIIKRRKLSIDRLFLVRYLVHEDVDLRDNHAQSHYYAEEA